MRETNMNNEVTKVVLQLPMLPGNELALRESYVTFACKAASGSHYSQLARISACPPQDR